MNTINKDELTKIRSHPICISSLEKLINESGVITPYKSDESIRKKFPMQNFWEKCIAEFNSDNTNSTSSSKELLLSMYYDLTISPYTGASFEEREPFYIWCLDRLEQKTQ